MKKICLVNPPLIHGEVYKGLSSGGGSMPPLGLCCLAAVLKKYGYNTTIIDAPSQGLDLVETSTMVLNSSPDVIGITAFTNSIHRAGQLAELIKNKIDNSFIIIGGPHITAVPSETMIKFPCFDIGAVGEGEKTIIDLLLALENGKSFNNVKGLVIRDDNGNPWLTGKQEYITNLDDLPFPAWELLEGFPSKYKPGVININKFPSALILTTRGCPGKCTFCDRAVFGSKIRAYSADYIFEEIKFLVERFKIRDIQIGDDTFVVFKARLIELCDKILKENLKITWNCNARVDYVDQDMLKLMKKAGCWEIGFGIESGSQEILDSLHKGISLKQIEMAVEWAKLVGISVKGYFMVGVPGETQSTLMQTADFIKRLDLDVLRISYFTPLPGSSIYKNIHKYGEFNCNWSLANLQQTNFIPIGLNKEYLENFVRKTYSNFYFRIKTYFYFLKKMGNFTIFMLLLKNVLIFSYYTMFRYKDNKR